MYADVNKKTMRKGFGAARKCLKWKARSGAAKQILIFTRKHFYSPQIDLSCKVKDTQSHSSNQYLSVGKK